MKTHGVTTRKDLVMVIKNLAQLKRAIEARTPFEIVKHFVHPQCTGQIRVANVIQKNGFYSVTKGEEYNEINSYNCGKGSWMPYGKASDWKFDGETITANVTRFKTRIDKNGFPYRDFHEEPVMTIRFLDKGEYENV